MGRAPGVHRLSADSSRPLPCGSVRGRYPLWVSGAEVTVQAELDEQVKAQLRGVLQAPDDAWKALLAAVLVEHGADLVGLMRLRAFLVQHLASAGERYRGRLEQMVATLEQRVLELAQDSLELERIAAELLDLQAQRDGILRQLELRRDLLELAVGPGNKRVLGAVRVSVSAPGVSLSVPEPELVPVGFSAPQPDRKAILEHFRATGEILPGTRISPRRPAVSVKLTPSGAGSDS
jgi:hypothetical protein